MPPDLPPFKVVSLPELRQFWNRCPDNDVRRLILEVERYHRAFAKVDRLHESIELAWKTSASATWWAISAAAGRYE